jgi:23S rRNA (adenine2503-C2)-methyltransferase
VTSSPRPTALTELDDDALTALIVERGGRPFVGKQVAHWLYRHGVSDYERMHNVPKALRSSLAATPLRSSTVAAVDSARDGTEKLLLKLHDGETIETVIIPDGDRITLCVSSQVGCPVACVFCASGLDGVRRNLSAGEIVEQVLHARDRLAARRQGHAPSYLTNLVVMGLGEPLLNLDALSRALDRISDPDGIALGARRITVSTSGLPARMQAFAALERSYNLAISLHAADDVLRKRLVPTAKASVAEIVAAARAVFEQSGREITFEVVLLAGVNDRSIDARLLARAIQGFPSTVNLIPWNPVDRIVGLARPSDNVVDRFADELRAFGVNVTVRRQRGADRSAACGQLRLRNLDGSAKVDGDPQHEAAREPTAS